MSISMNPFFYLLALVVSIVGAYSALSFTETLITTRSKAADGNGNKTNAVLLIGAAAFSFAVNGVWTMHYLASSAMSYGGGYVRSELWQTIASMLYIFICTCIAFAVLTCHREGVFGPDCARSPLTALYAIQPPENASFLAQYDHLKKQASAFANMRTVISGTAVGAGIVFMHYQGMGAMRMRGVAYWNPIMIGLLPFIVVAGGPVIIFIMFTFLGLRRRLVASVILGVVTLGLHTYGQFSATYCEPDESTWSSEAWHGEILIEAEVACVIVILCSSLLRFILMSIFGVVDTGQSGKSEISADRSGRSSLTR